MIASAVSSFVILLSLLSAGAATAFPVRSRRRLLTQTHLNHNNSRPARELTYFSCGTGNPVDDCWRCHGDWDANRKRLADCAIGFGRNAIGGRDGIFYLVTDPSDDPVSPRPGTLRHALIQAESLWIIFQRDMVIQPKQELLTNSYKTLDGRGANVHIANGGCITVQYVSQVIIHGLHIHDCVPKGNGLVRSTPSHVEWRDRSDGDGISIHGSSDVWVDHCSLSTCADGLIDVTRASTGVSITNNYMTQHDKVMLLGHSDSYTPDRQMRVTVAFNHFGEGLVERMPRCRFGIFDVVNNDYTHWNMYAIGGSADPTINSRGNRFVAGAVKEVTKREHTPESTWTSWRWRSQGDMFVNGAFFVPSGTGDDSAYAMASSLSARPASMVASMTSGAGVLGCRRGSAC